MRIKLLISTALMMVVLVLNSHAQEAEAFEPNGSAFAKLFMNYNSHFTDDGVKSEFEVTRGYFGYKYTITPEFSAQVMLDFGKASINDINIAIDTNEYNASVSSKLSQYTAFLKTAAIDYKKGNLKVSAGMIGLKQHKLSESFWKHRYIEKSFQDAFGFSAAADVGIYAEYKIHKMLSVDLTVRNGEGYKKLQSDNAFLTGIGYTITPVKGLSIRGYYDYLEKKEAQLTYSHFVGYKTDVLSLGFEYSAQNNHKDNEGTTVGGISGFASYNITEQIQLFGRYDSFSNNDHKDADASLMFVGVEYSPIKKLQIALNYRGKNYVETDDKDIDAIYVNVQLAF